jgi:hypothetical protein
LVGQLAALALEGGALRLPACFALGEGLFGGGALRFRRSDRLLLSLEIVFPQTDLLLPLGQLLVALDELRGTLFDRRLAILQLTIELGQLFGPLVQLVALPVELLANAADFSLRLIDARRRVGFHDPLRGENFRNGIELTRDLSFQPREALLPARRHGLRTGLQLS